MTMSCVAEAVATSSAASATISGARTGSWKPRNRIDAMSRSWVNTSQPRRWPSALLKIGTWKASTIGAHRNLMV